MRILFTKAAKKEYEQWQEDSPKIAQKINSLILSIKDDPFQGPGKPEPLKHSLKGYWSRRISREHRLVYKISGKEGVDRQCIVIQCKFHY